MNYGTNDKFSFFFFNIQFYQMTGLIYKWNPKPQHSYEFKILKNISETLGFNLLLLRTPFWQKA